MNATRRLMLASAAAAFAVGNALPVAGALLGQVGWRELLLAMPVLNLVYLAPAMLAAALAALAVARDPDFERVPAGYAGASLLLLAFVAYFLLLLAWLPAMQAAGLLPASMRSDAPVTLFMTLVLAAMAAVPGWAVASLAVRWARGPRRLPAGVPTGRA